MILALALAGLATLSAAAEPAPALELLPARARPGDAFLVHVRGELAAPPAGAVAGRDLAFFPGRHGQVAVAGLPVETPAGPLEVTVWAEAERGGERQALPLRAALDVAAPEFPSRALAVQREFVEPPPPELQRRIDADRAAFARAFAQPEEPPLFAGAFAWPRRARVTAGYGEQRTLNGVKPSQHYGLDLAGPAGAPVGAANDGRVVLVRDCWASGKTVILWHGAGLYTTYFHLARAAVAEGQRVRRGQKLGEVGATGRVSGPHLHWGVRVGDLYVDPRSVLRLRWPW
ncbi:M23 family metallopeptidase [Anaeromyxobacter diazotrophicus]|uniref:M23ase beta-sheet core domain-containing protein n=1 Tax=Anaeromyxobacter diazotrophicus TaxID=2590199 RepID=A0A7I9VIB9_9BACT|nr:M23 family metallopeptidase [Anaeromyxobacter diazotrophicus]GEJ55878.1 hypothetical protein AMYX_06190 [Anaeromyxobacter diazotrophicus]